MSILGLVFGWHAVDTRAEELTTVPTVQPKFNDDDYQRLALDMIWGRIPDMYEGTSTVSQCDDALAIAQQVRTEYAKMEPGRLRDAVMAWIVYYEDKVREAKVKIAKGTYQTRMAEYDAKRAAERERVRLLKQSLIDQGYSDTWPERDR